MADARERLGGFLNTNGESEGAAKVGANAHLTKLRFIPLPADGDPVTLWYNHGVEVLATHDYGELVFLFTTRTVIVEGENLEGLLTRFERDQLDRVRAVDPFEPNDGTRYRVTRVRFEPPRNAKE